MLDLRLVEIPLPRATLSGLAYVFIQFVLTPALAVAAVWAGVLPC